MDRHGDSLTVIVSGEDVNNWQALPLVQLEQWPFLINLSIILQHISPEQRNDSLMLPFLGQPPEVLARLRRLDIHSDDDHVDDPFPVYALASVLPALPNLRHLSLHIPLVVTPLQRHLLCDTLAVLPHFTCLKLPSIAALQSVGPLANRLTSLKFCDEMSDEDDSNAHLILDRPDLVAILPAFTGLRELEIQFSTGDDENLAPLLPLLNNLPLNLRRLYLPNCGLLGNDVDTRSDLVVELDGGARIIDIHASYISLHALSELAHTALLPHLLLDHLLGQVGLLSLDVVSVSFFDYNDLVLSHVQQLVRRCGIVATRRILLSDSLLLAEDVLTVWELLNGTAEQLERVSGPCELLLTLGPGPHGAAHVPADPLTSAADPNPLLQSPSFVDFVLDKLAAPVAGGPQGFEPGQAQRQLYLVLLTGTFVRWLGKDPVALHAWMQSVTAVVAGLALFNDQPPFITYTHFCQAGAVLVQCNSQAAATAAEAEARRSFAKVAPEMALPELHIRHVATVVPEQLTATHLFVNMACQVTQTFWEGGFRAAGSSARDRLRWVLQVWDELDELTAALPLL